MKKKILAAALGALMVSGSALAVEVAPAGKGDLLIAPLYMTGGGWKTELKVINTNTVDSAVAKVVFHAPGRSEELLDFLVFLSPGDVWTGVLSCTDANCTAVNFTSTEETSLTVASQANGCPAATGTAGINTNLTVPYTTGYVTIFETRMIRGLGAAPVAKSAILAAYSAACTAGTAFTTADTDNVLTGSVMMSNAQNGNQVALPMAAYANYDNLSYHSVGALTSFATNIANSTKAQVEDAMWASNFAIPYNNGTGQFTFATVTFPTKETYNNSAATQYAPFPGSVGVSYQVRDEAENVLGTVGCAFSPCAAGPALSLPNEVNIVALTTGGSIGSSTGTNVFTQTFTKGWVNAAIQTDVSDTRSNTNYNNFGTAGSPALVTYLRWDATGSSLQGSWSYAPATFAPGAR